MILSKYTLFFMICIFCLPPVFGQDSSDIDISRMQMVEEMDKEDLISHEQAISFRSRELLTIPQTVLHLKTKFSVAATEPLIQLVVIPVKERYQPDPPEEYHPTIWSNWGQGIYLEKTEKYLVAIGNNRFHDARIYLTEYDLTSGTIKNSAEVNQAIGRNLINGYGDGKIHGWLDLYNNSEIIFCTYWAHYPQPTEKYFAAGYDGGHIVSYNYEYQTFTDIDLPMPRVSWPYHRIDAKRGLLFAVGMFKEFLCYDLTMKKVRFAGFPPDGIMWNNRVMMVDDVTGLVYSTNTSKQDEKSHFIEYNPVKNKFRKMKSVIPPNIQSGARDQLRAHTARRSKEGWFIGVTKYNLKGPGGQLFKFYPDKDKVEKMNLVWPGEMRYTTSLALSPDEKYLYYLPGAHGKSHLEGSPVIQYNIRTGKRKVLAFLFPYLYEKFGYVPGGSFSVNIDTRGERLMICLNGQFIDYKTIEKDVFGDPVILVLHVPESERI